MEKYKNQIISMLKLLQSDFIVSAGDNDSIYLEHFLHEYSLKEAIDEFGNSEYSIQLEVKYLKIVNIIRISHLRSLNHENRDTKINIFPHSSLEAEARKEIEKILKKSG